MAKMEKRNFRHVSIDLNTYNQLSGLAKAEKLTRAGFLKYLIRVLIEYDNNGDNRLVAKILGIKDSEVHLKPIEELIHVLVERGIKEWLGREENKLILAEKIPGAYYLKTTPISKLTMSPRLANCLRRAYKYDRIGDLYYNNELKTRELLRLRNFGVACLNELRAALEKELDD